MQSVSTSWSCSLCWDKDAASKLPRVPSCLASSAWKLFTIDLLYEFSLSSLAVKVKIKSNELHPSWSIVLKILNATRDTDPFWGIARSYLCGIFPSQHVKHMLDEPAHFLFSLQHKLGTTKKVKKSCTAEAKTYRIFFVPIWWNLSPWENTGIDVTDPQCFPTTCKCDSKLSANNSK